MPSTDIIRRGDTKYYYRSKSVREGKKVKKVRKYLGKNLSSKELQKKEQEADFILNTSLNSLLTRKQREELEKISKIDKKLFSQPGFYESFISEFTYHSDAIEGNSFTLKETAMLLFENIVPKGKHPREIYEIINHKKAIDYILKYEGKLTKTFICKLQAIVTENTLLEDFEEQRGKYRTVQVFIRGANFVPPKKEEVPTEMRKLISWYNRNKNIHPSISAAYFHAGFESIHPFVDGNGRVGRLLINWMLHQNNFPMITIQVRERLKYYESLEKARKGNLKILLNIIIARIEKMAKKLQ
ncbi:Fic family protein [Candidatus Woesearchaeota archaeon]|nr:Fic family protein [Candidatus Woesearchaeota archaeon]